MAPGTAWVMKLLALGSFQLKEPHEMHNKNTREPTEGIQDNKYLEQRF